MLPPRAVRAVVLMGVMTSAAAGAACRSKGGDADASAQAPVSTEEPRHEGTGGEQPEFDGSTRFLDAGPKVAIDPDGPVDPACSGPEIAFAIAVVDKRCAIGSARAKQLRALLERDAGALPLKQEAKAGAEGEITLRLVNSGTAPLTLPLSYSSKLPAFTVLAEDERHAIFELEAPRFDVGLPGGPDASAANGRAHFARIVLPPGGAAVATIVVSPVIARLVGRRGGAGVGAAGGGGGSVRGGLDGGDAGADKLPDGGAPQREPARLAKGKYVLHVGELLTDVEAGAPARVTLQVP